MNYFGLHMVDNCFQNECEKFPLFVQQQKKKIASQRVEMCISFSKEKDEVN